MTEQPQMDKHLTSINSGSYDPGPMDDTPLPNDELSIVQAVKNDIQLEEFPEGPYGAATNEERLGKTSEWRKGQAAVSAFRDASPIQSDRKVALDEPEFNAPKGSIEGQN